MAQPTSSSDAIAIQRVTPPADVGRIELTSPAFPANGTIPDRYAEYGDGLSPPLQWTAVPGAKAYALILEDPDAPRAEPFLHWAIWDIPGDVTSLPESLPQTRRLDRPAGALQGRNDAGGVGYFGPRPPAGDRAHRYHFQIFALSAPIELPVDTALDMLLQRLQDNLVAEGELIGLYQHRTQ